MMERIKVSKNIYSIQAILKGESGNSEIFLQFHGEGTIELESNLQLNENSWLLKTLYLRE